MKKILLLILCLPLFGFGQDTINNDEDLYIMVIEKSAIFPGGDEALSKHIYKNLKYPEEAKKLNLTGKVYVNFTVNKEGDVTNVKIARGVNQLLDNEAIRIVQSFPKFSPATQKGKPITVPLTIPINFKLD